MQQGEQLCRLHWEDAGDMSEEMGTLREEVFPRSVWKGMCAQL